MFELLEDLQKEFMKNVQKAHVRVISRAFLQREEYEYQRVKQKAKDQLENAQADLKKASSELEEAIKGQFQKKAVATFEKQQKELDHF